MLSNDNGWRVASNLVIRLWNIDTIRKKIGLAGSHQAQRADTPICREEDFDFVVLRDTAAAAAATGKYFILVFF